jgi:serine/threonine protein kinase
VGHCHANGVAHRDLKLENIFLDGDDNVKLGDFGFSCEMKGGETLKESLGSPNYAAPELLRKKCEYEGSGVDVWSCGVILYALLCSELPFDEEPISALFRKIKAGSYSVPHFLTDEAQDLIAKMLVVDATSRIAIEGIKGHPWFTKDLPADLFEKTAEEQSEVEENTRDECEENKRSLEAEDSIWHQTVSTLLDFTMSVASASHSVVSALLPTSSKSPSTISLVASEKLLQKLTARCSNSPSIEIIL